MLLQQWWLLLKHRRAILGHRYLWVKRIHVGMLVKGLPEIVRKMLLVQIQLQLDLDHPIIDVFRVH